MSDREGLEPNWAALLENQLSAVDFYQDLDLQDILKISCKDSESCPSLTRLTLGATQF